jgi:hypothetical protein
VGYDGWRKGIEAVVAISESGCVVVDASTSSHGSSRRVCIIIIAAWTTTLALQLGK